MLMESLMMEEKQLDFNRPLLSVRRPVTQTSESESKTRSASVVTNKIPPPSPSSSSSPPVYKSDIKSGPIRNPGTVPFQWEHKPGKPKNESQCFVESHFVPKLPPGREQEQCRRNLEVKTVGNNNVASLDKYHVEDVKSYDDDDDDTYLEATDTFSRSESFFFNCSNVSGLDGSGLLVEPFGTLSSDRQTQELMMGRFLPAAKALTASETLPQLSKKPPKPEEEPQRRLIKKEKKQNKTEYRFHHSTDQEEEDLNSSRSLASGVCGLVPQFCLRSSFGILNPVPSVRMQAQRAVSVRRMRSKYQDSNEKQNKQTVNEDESNKSVAQGPSLSVSSNQEANEKLDNFSAVSRAKVSKKFGELLASDDNTCPEAPVAEKTLYVDTVHSVDKKVQEEFKKQSSLDVLDPPVKEDVPKSIGASEETILKPKRDGDKIEFSSLKVEECHDDHQTIVALQESNKIDIEVKLERNTTRIHHHIVPPPPLPKAPSDSWLKRTLPTIPSKNNSFTWLQSSDNNNHFTKIQSNPKWETMVKTSNTPFSKEPLNPIPEA